MILNYKDLSINKYLEIKEILSSDVEEYDKKVSLVAVLNDMTEDEVLELPAKKFHIYLQGTAFLFNEIERKIPKDSYVLGGRKYELVLDMDRITAGQYIDYNTFLKSDDIIGLLSVVLIPKGKKYGDYDMKAVHRDIGEYLSIEEGSNIADFFFQLSRSLMTSTVRYSTSKLRKMMRKEKDMEKVKMYQKAIAVLENGGVS